MLPPKPLLRKQLEYIIIEKTKQGHQTKSLLTKLKRLPDSYDAFAEFAELLRDIPMRRDWKYREPHAWADILNECAPDRPAASAGTISVRKASERARTAFLSSVCGCILGKPLEVNPTLKEIRLAAETAGEWPLRDYISGPLLDALGRRHPDWHETIRENISYVVPDDDINYSIIGMLVLENKGLDFTRDDLVNIWLHNLPPLWTWGPERAELIKAAIHSTGQNKTRPFADWVETWNPGEEACGAAIRVDAYGYACPGLPALAAELAWRDSSWTHSRTGVYASMFIAAAIAAAFVADTPLDIFETALKFVPQRSRFHEIVSDCFDIAAGAGDWLEGYENINARYGQYGHCQLYQECGLLINSARFATDIADAFCKQVSQGCDTDCFGEIIGSIMGAYMGPEYFDKRWLAPFHDDLRTSLANFHERSLEAVAQRMAKLPELGLNRNS